MPSERYEMIDDNISNLCIVCPQYVYASYVRMHGAVCGRLKNTQKRLYTEKTTNKKIPCVQFGTTPHNIHSGSSTALPPSHFELFVLG